jgi:hypothetical protein
VLRSIRGTNESLLNSLQDQQNKIRRNSMTRQMVMVGFLQAQNCTNIPGSWRHPESRDDSTSPEYYQEIARILEAGKFHVGFFDDRLAMPDRYGNDHAHTVEYGIRATKMDPVVILMAMAAVTKKLGLAATASTTYYEPFDIARRFADARPDDAWPRGVERRHVGQRRRGAEHGPRRASRTRSALRPRRRIRRDRARPLGFLGRRRDPGRQDNRPLRRPDESETARLQGKIPEVARPVHGAALAAGPSRRHSGRRQRARPPLRRALGRGDFRRRPQHRDGEAELRRGQATRRSSSAAIPIRSLSATC